MSESPLLRKKTGSSFSLEKVGDQQSENWLAIYYANAHENLWRRRQAGDHGMLGSDDFLPVPSSLPPLDAGAGKHLSSSPKHLSYLLTSVWNDA